MYEQKDLVMRGTLAKFLIVIENARERMHIRMQRIYETASGGSLLADSEEAVIMDSEGYFLGTPSYVRSLDDLAEVRVDVTAKTGDVLLSIEDGEMRYDEDGNRIIGIDTSPISGNMPVWATVTARVVDLDTEDGYRTEIHKQYIFTLKDR